MTAQPPQQQVSPEATGGAGTIEEYTLGAVALARLLTGDLLPGLSAPLVTVALQRRVTGNTLDDLVLRSGTRYSWERHRLSDQAHRVPNPFRLRRRRRAWPMRGDAAAAAGGRRRRAPATGVRGFRSAGTTGAAAAADGALRRPRPSWACSSRVQPLRTCGRGTGTSRARWPWSSRGRGETLTDAELDELTYELLTCLRVWIFEVGDDGRDVLDAQSRLATILPAGGPEAQTVFSQLRTLAETWGPNAGVIDAPMLRAALNARGIPLNSGPAPQDGTGTGARRLAPGARPHLGPDGRATTSSRSSDASPRARWGHSGQG